MTLAIDVSKIFPQMCMVSYTNEMIQKKMIYLYLTTQAKQNKEMVFMAIRGFIQENCRLLLWRLKVFNEQGQAKILDELSKYQPKRCSIQFMSKLQKEQKIHYLPYQHLQMRAISKQYLQFYIIKYLHKLINDSNPEIRTSLTRQLAKCDIANQNAMEQLFYLQRLYNIAAGEENNVLQMYFYGVHKFQVLFELEVNNNWSIVILNTISELEDLAFLAQKNVQDDLQQQKLIS